MSFGSELKDQVSTVNQHIQNGIQFIHEFREFVKERAQIEKEYANKLEGLAKKHILKKEKKAVTMSIGDVANTLSEKDFNEAKSEPSTFLNAWTRILEETENVAKERHKFSESISTNIMEELKTVSIKKEEMRKKHMQFSSKLALERDKVHSENQKAKARYNESCLEVLNSQQKQEKAPDEKVLEKLRKQTQEAIIDMNNNKNLYILSIRISNEHKHKYYNSDMPSLIDQLQELDGSRTSALKRIWEDYVNLELNVLNDSISHLNSARRNVQSINDHKDSELFIKYNKHNNQEEPPDLKFVSSSSFDDDDVLVNDEDASVFLSNKLSKSRQRLSELTQEIEAKRKQLDGLLSLKDAYENNHKLGDSDTVTEDLYETIRNVTLLETSLVSYQTEVDSIIEAIGDGGFEIQPHDFKSAAFAIPTTCDLCQNTIWGIAKQGFTCKDCGYNCHAKCEMKVPPNCTKQKYNRAAHGSRATIYSETPSSPPSRAQSEPSKYKSISRSASSVASTSKVNKVKVAKVEVDENLETWTANVLYDHVADSISELTVSSGDVITVLEPDDGSGWVMASTDGKSGLVPAAYIEYISDDCVRALYDYDAQSHEEISIKEGDIIEVTNRDIGGGWWEGTLNGRTGQFPANYVTSLK
ncbi:hypothetical protein Glove_177g134 [Diversispora epigaea]|uniref:Protein BZZ1 n=1 Tax=Diversispora epigaea TaxID=1348612 RepID=A0A397IN97_9GLOM|nr:hypothetical protein Glove_177g134 [Diversispora epigaea]